MLLKGSRGNAHHVSAALLAAREGWPCRRSARAPYRWHRRRAALAPESCGSTGPNYSEPLSLPRRVVRRRLWRHHRTAQLAQSRTQVRSCRALPLSKIGPTSDGKRRTRIRWILGGWATTVAASVLTASDRADGEETIRRRRARRVHRCSPYAARRYRSDSRWCWLVAQGSAWLTRAPVRILVDKRADIDERFLSRGCAALLAVAAQDVEHRLSRCPFLRRPSPGRRSG